MHTPPSYDEATKHINSCPAPPQPPMTKSIPPLAMVDTKQGSLMIHDDDDTNWPPTNANSIVPTKNLNNPIIGIDSCNDNPNWTNDEMAMSVNSMYRVFS